jgi:hypothetical protein
MEEGESYLPAEDGHRGVHFIGEAGRPGWLPAPPWLGFLPARSSPLCDMWPRAP